jgi:hypothetical protein
METKSKILFICQHNSGRSQIAEAYLKKYVGDQFQIESAGMEPAERVNPLVVEVMKEEGFDLSDKKPQSVFELFKEGRLYDHVSPSAMIRKINVHCFLVSPSAGIGPFQILPKYRAHMRKKSQKSVKSEIR